MEYKELTIIKRLAALETVQKPPPRLLLIYVLAGQTDDSITGAIIDSTTYQRHDGETVTDFMQRLESCPNIPAIAFVTVIYGAIRHKSSEV